MLHAAGALRQRREELLAANALDVQAGREAGMSRALLDRLSLTEARIQDMAAAWRRWPSPPTRWGRPSPARGSPTACSWRRSRCPWGLSASSTRPGPTSPATRRPPVPEGGERRHPPGREGGLPLQPGGGQGAAGGLGGRGPACRLRPAGGGHFPPVRPRADGPDGVPGRAHPPGAGRGSSAR